MGSSHITRLLVRIACFLPLLGMLLLIDWVSVQPPVLRRVLRSRNAGADALISGRTIWSSDDARHVKAAWLTRLPPRRPDVLILGSSRVIQISRDWFQPRRMWNAAVFSADLDDEIAMFQLCLETGKTPQTVVLELNPHLTFGGKMQMTPYLAHAFRRYGEFPARFLSGLVALDGLRWDLKILQQPVWTTADVPIAGGFRMRPDGSSDWFVSQSNFTSEQVQASVEASLPNLDKDELAWRTDSHASAEDLKLLHSFLDDLQSRGIRVFVLLPPLHPSAYAFYSRRGGYDDTWLRRDLAARGIPVVGSFSPAVIHATPADFYDAVHAHPEVLHRLLSDAGVLAVPDGLNSNPEFQAHAVP